MNPTWYLRFLSDLPHLVERVRKTVTSKGLLTTRSRVAQRLTHTLRYKYVMTSRFCQDELENL